MRRKRTIAAESWTWWKPAGGVGLVSDDSGDLVLCPRAAETDAPRWLPSYPLRAAATDPGRLTRRSLRSRPLHRAFADIVRARRPERVAAAFANAFGFLGAFPMIHDPDEYGEWAESLDKWLEASYRMHRLVHFWDVVLRDDRRAAGEVIRWNIDPPRVYEVWYEPGNCPEVPSGLHREHHERRRLASRDEGSGPRITFRYGRGRGFLASLVQAPDLAAELPLEAQPSALRGRDLIEHFEGQGLVQPVVEPLRYAVVSQVARVLRDRVRADLVPYAGSPVAFAPDSLLAACYVSFASEIEGRHVRRYVCPGCRDFFIREHGRQRYCSEECRKRTWDRRHRSRRAVG